MATLTRIAARLICAGLFALPLSAAQAAAQAGITVDNQANVQFTAGGVAATVESNVVNATVQALARTATPPTLRYYNSSYTRIARATHAGMPLYLEADATGCDLDSSAADTVTLTIWSHLTGDVEQILAREITMGGGIFRVVTPVPTQQADSSAHPNNGVLETRWDDTLTAEIPGCGANKTEAWILIDPAGIVFDSRTNLPIAGARVTLIDVTGQGNGGNAGGPAIVFDVDGVTAAPSTIVTGANGIYSFPLVPASSYRLEVTGADGYVFPSVFAPSAFAPERIIDPTGSYGGPFPVNAETGAVTMDLPLDRDLSGSLVAQKTSSRSVAEIGEFVDYTVSIRNIGPLAIDNTTVNDRMPAGFIYQPGSARVDSAAIADPAGGRGPVLNFTVGTVETGSARNLTYRVRLGAAALQGDGINRAQASGSFPVITSNLAVSKLEVQGGVFSDDAFVLGKIYADCNNNSMQDDGEPGIPGVRFYMEDGTYVISDEQGKYSLYGLTPRTHVLKADTTTLPAGTKLKALSNRNAGDASSLFVDLKNGELHRADFAVAGCSGSLKADIGERAKHVASEAQFEQNVKTALVTDATARALGDLRAQPASGVIGGTTVASPNQQPLSSTAKSTTAAAPATQLAARGEGFGFINLTDGEQLSVSQTAVQIQGRSGSLLTLTVNDEVVPDSRIGTRKIGPHGALELQEYVGVNLQPGKNTLMLTQASSGLREHRVITVYAPGELARITIEVAANAPSGGDQAARIRIRLLDAKNLPVGGRSPVTLETTAGQWQTVDLDRNEPGTQVFIENGTQEFALLSPREPGSVRIRASSATFKDEIELPFNADLRPMMAVGVVEGVLDLRRLDTKAMVPARAQDNFERELSGFSRSAGDGTLQGGARAALLLKGKVKGSYLLTLGYDSDKEKNERLFRDIQPDQFYPVYGDAGIKGFEAQSTGQLYVRIDKNRSYLLYGDYQTQTDVRTAESGRTLAAHVRSLNGVKEHFEHGRVKANAFASQDSTRQIVDELRANGTSGPYSLSAGDGLINSETVEIITRDRNQPAIVISSVAQTRFLDYDVEPFTGRLLFRAPVRSVDENLNPVSIRVTYEVDSGGRDFWVAGGDAEYQLTERVTVGGVAIDDRNPMDQSRLMGLNARIKLAEKTTLTMEAARTDRDSIGAGDGQRIELRHEIANLQMQAYAGRTDSTFDNPSSALNKGREEGGVRAAYRLSDNDRLLMEGIHTADIQTGSNRDGALVGVEHSFARNNTRLEAGTRFVRNDSGVEDQDPTDTTSVRVKVSTEIPRHPQASVYGEVEQNVSESDEKLAAIGGEYRLQNRGRIYARHEFISSLSGPYSLDSSQEQNATIVGLDADYMKDGHSFSEYRVRDGISGREAEAAMGLRNRWTLAQGVRFDTGFERVHAFSDLSQNESTALTGAIEYTRNPLWKGTARLELRNSPNSDGLLNTLGLARKLSDDWTMLARSILSLTDNKGANSGDRTQARFQIGAAYRDNATNRLSALARYEFKREEDTSPVVPLDRYAHIVSMHANYQPAARWVYTARYAVKQARENSLGLKSDTIAHLVSARATCDIASKWDVGVIASALFDDSSGRQLGLGVEGGRQLKDNLWMSVGYNLFGFEEKDLAEDYTTGGVYLRLRMKFDENLFSRIGARK